ncbi:MAG: hypothetical protein IJW16_00305 [Clostridia bacterium]|nr:hypothetical protein [Clostridia bacterium]
MISAIAHNGVICFEHSFSGEQEYLVKLYRDETLLAELPIYSLSDDLYDRTPLKADFHSHSFRSDGKRDPAATAGHYREQAYDCYALTDHNRFYPGGEVDETYRGVDMEFFRINGEEVHTPGSIIHIVHVGGSTSVAELYVKDTDGFNNETEEYKARVPKQVPAQYVDRYALAMWATDKIHAAGGLAIFPHPFWKPGGSQVNNVCSDFAKLLLKSGMFDAYELVGGMKQIGNNLSVALWNDLRAEGLNIPVVGSSDVHGYKKSAEFPHLYTICFAKERTADAVLEAIKTGMTVAVEASGTEYDRHYRCYGSYRLVAYAQFLLNNFFRQMERICTGEGVAMRAYAIGEAEKELIELQSKQSRAFRARFFGKEPPILPSAETLEFEERWREVQRNGPQTRGSAITTPPVNYQI